MEKEFSPLELILKDFNFDGKVLSYKNTSYELNKEDRLIYLLGRYGGLKWSEIEAHNISKGRISEYLKNKRYFRDYKFKVRNIIFP